MTKESWREFWRGLRHQGPGYLNDPSWGAREREAWDRKRLRTFADSKEQLDHFLFVRDVMDILYQAGVREDLLWYVKESRLHLSVDVSGLFWRSGADSEDITPETMAVFRAAYRDLKTLGHPECLPDLYAARVRGMRPQGAAYPEESVVQPLFDACGPERTTGPGNGLSS